MVLQSPKIDLRDRKSFRVKNVGRCGLWRWMRKDRPAQINISLKDFSFVFRTYGAKF
jgi:hypothetical protein